MITILAFINIVNIILFIIGELIKLAIIFIIFISTYTKISTSNFLKILVSSFIIQHEERLQLSSISFLVARSMHIL